MSIVIKFGRSGFRFWRHQFDVESVKYVIQLGFVSVAVFSGFSASICRIFAEKKL